MLAELKEKLGNLTYALEKQQISQSNSINSQNARIGDISSNTNMWGIIFSAFGLVITLGAIGLGFTAKNRAVKEAKEASQKWIFDNQQKLTDKILLLEKHAEQAITSIDLHVGEITDYAIEAKNIVDNEVKSFER